MQLVITALVMGLAGSLHCAGMCSPLAMAVTNLTPTAFLNKLIYNSGRILTYGMLGAIISSVGFILPLEKFQNVIAISLGILMLVSAFIGIKNTRIPFITPLLQKVVNKIKSLFSSQLKTRTYPSMFLMGAINGILPCGLTFIALTFCLSLAGPLDGFQFMLLFGAGTLPVMLGFTSLIQLLIRKFNISFNTLTSTTLIIAGCLLIARVFLMANHAHAAHATVMDIILCKE